MRSIGDVIRFIQGKPPLHVKRLLINIVFLAGEISEAERQAMQRGDKEHDG